jgi:hypothetical protein
VNASRWTPSHPTGRGTAFEGELLRWICRGTAATYRDGPARSSGVVVANICIRRSWRPSPRLVAHVEVWMAQVVKAAAYAMQHEAWAASVFHTANMYQLRSRHDLCSKQSTIYWSLFAQFLGRMLEPLYVCFLPSLESTACVV